MSKQVSFFLKIQYSFDFIDVLYTEVLSWHGIDRKCLVCMAKTLLL